MSLLTLTEVTKYQACQSLFHLVQLDFNRGSKSGRLNKQRVRTIDKASQFPPYFSAEVFCLFQRAFMEENFFFFSLELYLNSV